MKKEKCKVKTRSWSERKKEKRFFIKDSHLTWTHSIHIQLMAHTSI